ncbi:30S ribosomal protein S15 [Thermogymnomonas acidicola]|uniref:30S ribosomal protein S15 n=1 Tax=Thermogymnomonas acidicola TaxID=399579 RepID=UPI0009466040|nr:30S ribosomal protein S15 [Thermogymnomonas acidicola]
MARLHTRKRGGKSGSKRVYTETRPSWVQMSDQEVVDTIRNLRSQGMSYSMIGITLRDQYGIPSTRTVMRKKLGKIIQELGMAPQVPEDLMNLIERYRNITKHVEMNKNDLDNKRRQALLMSKILRLVKYYKREGYLSEEWNLSKVL